MLIDDVLKIRAKLNVLMLDVRNYENKLESILQPFFDFEIGITYCEGDGFLILNVENNNVCQLEIVTKIKENKKLTKDDFMNYAL